MKKLATIAGAFMLGSFALLSARPTPGGVVGGAPGAVVPGTAAATPIGVVWLSVLWWLRLWLWLPLW